jgi:hypothetical protein
MKSKLKAKGLGMWLRWQSAKKKAQGPKFHPQNQQNKTKKQEKQNS